VVEAFWSHAVEFSLFMLMGFRVPSRKERDNHVRARQKDLLEMEEFVSMTEVPEEKPPNLEELLETEKKRSEEYLSRLKYLQADFENLKKRYDRQITEVKSYCTESLVVQLLDVVDELELAIKSARSSANVETLIQGVEMTLKKLRKILEQEGVFPIECEGKVFDPSRHNAVAAVERDDVEGCVVVEEVRKGYIMKSKVIRPSIVKVAVESSKSQEENEKNE
jgi:molecular chaperone GrpE